jgi:hypothetical protein
MRLTVRPYFLRVVAGCCQNGVCCHTNYWKNHEKKYLKKIISDLPTLSFSRYETGTTGIFFMPQELKHLCTLILWWCNLFIFCDCKGIISML